MALHLAPLVKGALALKGMFYVFYRAHQNGWDPEKTGQQIVKDSLILLGAGKRYYQLTRTIRNAYDAKSEVAAARLCQTLEQFASDIETDGTLPEQRLGIATRIRRLYSVPFAAAGFHMCMRNPDINDTPDKILRETFVGLYLYGRVGQRFSDNHELRHVAMKLLELLIQRDQDTDLQLRTILASPVPSKTSALREAFQINPEVRNVQRYVRDKQYIECMLYALNMDVPRPDTTDVGPTLMQQFAPS